MKSRIICLGGLLLAIVLPVRADAPKPQRTTVALELLKTKHLVIMVKINGKGPYRMLFDTGAPLTLVSTKVAKESNMLPKDAKTPPLSGALGPFPIQKLEIGTAHVGKMPAVVMDHPAVTALARTHGPLEGIVGYPFFAHFTMTIDYEAKELTLVPNGYEPADVLQTLKAMLASGKLPEPTVLTPAAVWGLVVHKDAKDEAAGVTIAQVRPDSAAAAAGLKGGDRLLAIDGRWTESVADCYRAAAAFPAGSTVPVRIRRDGKETMRTVRPRAGL